MKEVYVIRFLDVSENIHLISYSFISFFLPFLLAHPQWFVGIVVNAMLISSAMHIKGWKILPVIVFPSIAVLSRGLIFGPFSIYLLYFMPFIWAGNWMMVIFMRKTKSYWKSASFGIVAKSLFLFLIAVILVSLKIVPAIFLMAMGPMQLLTATGGSFLARPLFKKI